MTSLLPSEVFACRHCVFSGSAAKQVVASQSQSLVSRPHGASFRGGGGGTVWCIVGGPARYCPPEAVKRPLIGGGQPEAPFSTEDKALYGETAKDAMVSFDFNST